MWIGDDVAPDVGEGGAEQSERRGEVDLNVHRNSTSSRPG